MVHMLDDFLQEDVKSQIETGFPCLFESCVSTMIKAFFASDRLTREAAKTFKAMFTLDQSIIPAVAFRREPKQLTVLTVHFTASD